MPATQMRKLSKARLKRAPCSFLRPRKADASTVTVAAPAPPLPLLPPPSPSSYSSSSPVLNVLEKSRFGTRPSPTVDGALVASTLIAAPTGPAFSHFFFGKTVSSVDVGGNVQPPDPRKLKLGKTIRVLHERLPTLLLSPLPQEILSPQITLHLFPSTHPHLPTVSGRIAYTAALWTAPVAWGRVPVIGNVKLEILSERMYKNGTGSAGSGSSAGSAHQERLVVRWKTCENNKTKAAIGGRHKGDAGSINGGLHKGLTAGSGGGGSGSDGQVARPQSGDKNDNNDKAFSGLFLFEFDEHGRILSHTIEHAQEGGNWDKMPRMISVTDWLLEKAWGKKLEEAPGLALGYCEVDQDRSRYIKALADGRR